MSKEITISLAVICWMVFIFVLVLMTAGCATDQAVARVETVETKVPVAVACVKPEDIPKVPAKATTPPNADVQQIAAAIGVELLQRRQYDERADALLKACATLPQPTKGP